jgi:hypothetical protein
VGLVPCIQRLVYTAQEDHQRSRGYTAAADTYLLQATRSGHVEMVKAVLGDVRLRTAGRPLELDVHEATHLAYIKGHTALVRHLFEKYSLTLTATPAHQTSAVATTYADDNVLRRSKILDQWIQHQDTEQSFGGVCDCDVVTLAAQNGHRAVIDLVVKFGGTLKSLHLAVTLSRIEENQQQPLPVFHMYGIVPDHDIHAVKD